MLDILQEINLEGVIHKSDDAITHQETHYPDNVKEFINWYRDFFNQNEIAISIDDEGRRVNDGLPRAVDNYIIEGGGTPLPRDPYYILRVIEHKANELDLAIVFNKESYGQDSNFSSVVLINKNLEAYYVDKNLDRPNQQINITDENLLYSYERLQLEIRNIYEDDLKITAESAFYTQYVEFDKNVPLDEVKFPDVTNEMAYLNGLREVYSGFNITYINSGYDNQDGDKIIISCPEMVSAKYIGPKLSFFKD